MGALIVLILAGAAAIAIASALLDASPGEIVRAVWERLREWWDHD